LYQAYDSILSSRIAFLDISKAFDRVDHTCLLFKIQQLGIDGPVLNLLSSYLSQRSPVVLINRTLSDLKYTSCGVPQDLSTLYNWSKVWNIDFDPSKTAVMTISNQRNIHPPLFFNNIHLSETDTHKHLALIFHHSLSWHTHILHIHQKVMPRINRLRSFSNSLPRHSLLTIYKTNILPIFDYGSIIYDNCSIATNICWIRPNSPLKSY